MSVASSNPVSRALRTRRANSAPRRHPKTGRLATLLAATALIAQAVPALAVPAVAAAAGPTPTIAVAVDNGTAANGTYTGFTGATQQLTTNGKTDWRIWGKSSTSLTGDARRAGGAGISGLTQIIGSPVVSGTALRALGSCCNLTWGVGASTVPFAFDWTDGASGATTGSKVKAGLQHNSGTNAMRGYGFSFTVPATTSLQRLKVWVDAHHGTGKLTATIGSVTKVDAGIVGNENEGRIFTLDFAGDGTANQVMTVSYVLASAGTNTNASNVAIHAAALSPAADFTVAAAPSSLTVAQGASAPSTINVAAVGSSTGTVALAAVSSGSGVTPSLSSATYVLGVLAGAGPHGPGRRERDSGQLHGHGHRNPRQRGARRDRDGHRAAARLHDLGNARRDDPRRRRLRLEHDRHRSRRRDRGDRQPVDQRQDFEQRGDDGPDGHAAGLLRPGLLTGPGPHPDSER